MALVKPKTPPSMSTCYKTNKSPTISEGVQAYSVEETTLVVFSVESASKNSDHKKELRTCVGQLSSAQIPPVKNGA